MDRHDHTITAGHEVHNVHLCHICGWPFPNPHPSAKHRRAHKRVCGTIEGYKITHSEEHDHNTAVSEDDDHASNEDDHTPSPNPAKKDVEKFGSGGGVGEVSNRSEDDVFTDAVTEFSDSGISPQALERVGSATELNEGPEKKTFQIDSHGLESFKAEEPVDKTELYNGATNEEEMQNPGAPTTNIQSGIDSSITDRAEAISVGLGNSLEEDVLKTETPRDVVEDDGKNIGGEIQNEQKKVGQDSDRRGENPASVNGDSKSVVSDHALLAVESDEKFHDELVLNPVEFNLLPETETLGSKEAYSEIESSAVCAEINCSTGTSGEIAPAKETKGNIDAYAGLEQISAAEDVKSVEIAGDILHEDNLRTLPVKPSENAVSSAASDPSNDAESNKPEIKQTSSFTEVETVGNDASKEEKCEVGENEPENENHKSKDNDLDRAVALPVSANGTVDGGHDQTKMVGGDERYTSEKSDTRSSGAVIEKGGGDSEELKVIPESTIHMDKPAEFPCSTEEDSIARNVEQVSKKPNSGSVESNLEKCVEGQSSHKLLGEELHSVSSASIDAELNHDVSILDKQSGAAASEYTVFQVISQLPKDIHEPSNAKFESAPVAGMVKEIKEVNVVVASESTPEQLSSKESTFIDSELSNEYSAKEDSCIEKGVREFDNDQVNLHVNAALHPEISESPKKLSSEALPEVKERLIGETSSLGTGENHAIKDISISKHLGIVRNAEQTSDSNIAASEKCSATPSLDEAVGSAAFLSQESHSTSAPVDEKNIINVEPPTSDNSKSLQDEVEDKVIPVTATDLQDNSGIKPEGIDGNCGVVSDSCESNAPVSGTNSTLQDSLTRSSQQHITIPEEARPNKSQDLEPPSFMTLVQSGDTHEHTSAASEIEAVPNNQHPKPETLQAGWFPSLTNVVNESQGRKQNEEIISKVTNSSPVKHHSPLKNLLSEAKSPTAKQDPAPNTKNEMEPINNGAGAAATTLTTASAGSENDHDAQARKEIDGWNSPARYPIETKKEKKKGKPYWVPFMCCSSIHKDL
ncbi:uncharacterized protein LOC127241728 [Andrographis paniculata]|uniref:uncharacterized protein LOC127241728 n=1 Tax=Andrographis paniculata TaxID=175694 RepID=UPI0021E6F6BF|nr:uncharacterized protein LOC127241728 [Andrographis paniculata]